MFLLQAVLKTVQFDIPQRLGIVKALQLNPGGTRAGELIKVAISAGNDTAHKWSHNCLARVALYSVTHE